MLASVNVSVGTCLVTGPCSCRVQCVNEEVSGLLQQNSFEMFKGFKIVIQMFFKILKFLGPEFKILNSNLIRKKATLIKKIRLQQLN